MSQEFKDWAEDRGIKIQLTAKDAHHQLGKLERNHQVRREQITIYGDTHKKDSLRQAVRMTTPQRNRLRNVKGYSPTQLVLGVVPRLPGTLADEDFRLSELKTDKRSEVLQDLEGRTRAGKAFLQANTARAVRGALLSRIRPLTF